jgi:hypothetical protein
MPPVILLTTTVDWPFAARLAGGFAQMKAHVEALAPQGHVLAKSRYVSVFHRYRPLAPERALERAIAGAKPDLLIPCDDRALAQALHVWRRAEARRDDKTASLFVRSLGNPAIYDRLTARAEFIADARAQGILAPEMRAADSEAALEEALSALGLPAVLKADGSWGGDGVVIARTREEAREAWLRLSSSPSRARSLYRAVDRRDFHRVADAFNPPKVKVGVQAYVVGVPATSTFAARKGEVLAALHFDVVVAPDARGPASVVRHIEDSRMDMAVQRIAHRYHLSGLHGLDYVRDSKGNAHLIEINPRATPTSHLALGERGDLPAALSASFFSPRLKPRPAIAGTETRDIALFPQEWLRDSKSPHLSSAHHDVPWDDPALLYALVGKPGAQALAGDRAPPADLALSFPKPRILQGE